MIALKPYTAYVGPTPRQQEILDYIKFYQAIHRPSPTVREIGEAVGLSSTSGVQQHLDNLEKKGLIRRAHGHSRAIEIVERES